MKKFILILLMTFTLTSFFAINIFAINVDYTFNITDNKKWNLETGSIENDLKFAVTSKMIIKDDRIITSSETYHHVVFWNSKNQFIGYKNSQYSILENDYYLGNIEYGSAGFDAPANAHFFSFMIYKSGNAINYTELGNQSLSDIFDLYNSSNLEDKDNNSLDGYSLDQLYNTQLSGKNLFDGNFYKGNIDSNGTLIPNTALRSALNLPVNASTTYVSSFHNNQSTDRFWVYEYDINQTFIARTITYSSTYTEYSFTTGSSTAFVSIYLGAIDDTYIFQFEKGSTATDFEPHASVLTREYFKDYEQIANTNYTELDNGRLRYVVNQDTISSNSQPLYELNGLSLDDVFNTGNLVLNGDFSNGTTGWLPTASTLSVSNNILTQTSDGTSSTMRLGYKIVNGSGSSNEKYYINLTSKHTYQATSYQIILRDIGAFGNILGIINVTNDVNVSNYVDYSTILTTSNSYTSNLFVYFNSGGSAINDSIDYSNVLTISLTNLGLENLTEAQLDAYFDIYAYFRDGGTDPQTFTYDSPIYYDITYRLDEQFNELDITAQEFIDNQDGYNRIINNEQANDFILYYAAQYAQDNNTSLGLSIQEWEQYYLNYLTFDDANSPFIASLNYNSLNDVFLDGNLIENYDFSNGTNNWSMHFGVGTFSVLNNQAIVSRTSSNNSGYFVNSPLKTFILNDKYYINVKASSNDTQKIKVFTPTTDVFNSGNDYTNISSIIDNYSWLYTVVNPSDSLFGFTTFHQSFDVGDQTTIYESPYLINLTDLGIDNLSKAQMDAYYDDYLDNQTLEQNLYLQALTPTSFDLIDPNYDYTAPPPDDFLDVDSETFLDNLLTNIGFNNDLGRIGLSLVVLFFTALTLIKLNMPNSVIISVEILTFVGLSFLGWLPAWINIVIALGIIILLYLRFKGNGGGSNEEND